MIAYWTSPDAAFNGQARLIFTIGTPDVAYNTPTAFDDYGIWFNLDQINNVEHTYKILFDAMSGVATYYLDGVAVGSTHNRAPNTNRTLNQGTNIWVAAGWGARTPMTLKTLIIKG